jgi:hypothetical protein
MGDTRSEGCAVVVYLDQLPPKVRATFRDMGLTSMEDVRKLGREKIARLPGMGAGALAAIYPEHELGRRRQISPAELDLALRWYNAIAATNPGSLGADDHALGRKLAKWRAR